MKENFTTVLAKFLLAIAIVAVVGVTSCAKDDAGGSPTITFENDDNRVDFSLSSTLDGYSFAEGSQVLVVDANANELTYILTNGVWTPASMDDYFVWGSEQSQTFSFYYPASVGTGTFTLPTDQNSADLLASANYMLVESVDIANGEVAAATLDAQMAQVTISAKSFASSIDATDQVVQSVTIYSDGNAITSFGDGDSYTAFVEPNDNEAYGETFVVIGFGESSATSSYKSTYTPVLAAAGVYNFAYDITANGDITAWDGETKTAPTVGDGSVSSPYEVSTAAELAYFQDYIASTFHIKITADIDLGYNSWTPIGTSTTSMNVFFGSCDGGGYTIYGLKVNSDPSLNDGQYTSSLYRGLFSLIDVQEFDSNNCTLSNINIENAIVYANNPEEGTYEYQGYGILCGMAQAKTLSGTKRVPVIDNCHVSGTIYCTSNSYAAGGLVGNTNEVVIKNSSADVTITGSSSSVGGLVGYGFGVQISDCTASGSISGTWCVGGLVGVAEGYSSSDVTITDSKSYTNVTATNWNVGGFIGFNYATITNCYAYGDVYSNVNFSDDITRTGGFVGCNYEDGSSISNSGFEGTLSGLESDSCYGGFVGYCFGGSSITNCYFDSSKNPSLNSNGESSYNDTDSYTNSISNTVPTL